MEQQYRGIPEQPDFLKDLDKTATKAESSKTVLEQELPEDVVHCQYCEDTDPNCRYCQGRWF